MSSGSLKNNRSSNIELFRIIIMLFIVAHHYVVNSGLTDLEGPIISNPASWRSLFLLLFGAWGKTGVNCFVLITGYFMCQSKITISKFIKLLFEIEFYKFIIYLVFLFSGYIDFSLVGFVKTIIPVTSIEQNFTGCYIIFFLSIPFLNVLIRNLTEKQHVYLILLCSITYVFIGTIPSFGVSMNYVSWFITLYFVSSYIRLYTKKIYDNMKFWGMATLLLIITSSLSIVTINTLYGPQHAFYFVADSNKILAIATALSSFMFFKNIKMEYSPFINTVAASAFGVLLIHANSNAMRQWLWEDTLKNVQMYSSPLMVIHAVGSVVGIYIICIIIDWLRIRFIEKPFFRFWDKNINSISVWCKNKEEKICRILKIKED